MAILVALAVVVVVLLIVNANREALFRLHELNRKARKIMSQVPGPPSIPILGSAHLFKWNVVDFTHQLEQWGRELMMKDPLKSGGLLHLWIGPVPLLVAGTHESIKPILESSIQIAKPDQYDIIEKWLGRGLLINTGDSWHARRKLLTPAFHFNILRRYIPVFGEQGEIMTSLMDERADSGEVVDFFPLIKRCSLDVIGETAMGIRLGTQLHDNTDYIEAVYRLSAIAWDCQRFPWLWLKPIWHLSGYARDFEKSRKTATDFILNVIKQRREILKDEGLLVEDVNENQVKTKKLALLDLLLLMQKANALSDEDLRSEVDTFMFEGSDTNSSNIGYCTWFLGQNPHEQARVHAEVDEVFGSSDRAPSEEDLCKLVFIERCIKESLRLMAPVPVLARRMVQDLEMGERIIPEGMTVCVSPLSAHRDPRCWERPEDFYPDHFLPEEQASRNAFSYIPFSAGPRNCIGQKFAMLEAKSIIAQVFRRFRVESIDTLLDNRPLPEIILKPEKGFRMRLYRR